MESGPRKKIQLDLLDTETHSFADLDADAWGRPSQGVVFLSGTSPWTIRGYGYKKESGKANKVDNGMREMSHKSRCSEITRVNGSLSWALPKAGEGGGL